MKGKRILDKVSFSNDLKKMSFRQLGQLAEEIREFLVQKVSCTGGHLASNLGVVEITLALHRFLDLPKDNLVFDVGHQCYSHKILTGRKNGFDRLRMRGGLSGFPDPAESRFDLFKTGHASVSISAAMGLAEVERRRKKPRRTVTVIGDGAFAGGVALEAINQIGYLGTPMIIVLNDNRMSIAQNVGALSEYTKRIEKTEIYQNVRDKMRKVMENCRDKKEECFRNLMLLKKSLKEVGMPGLLFEKLGIHYIGPVDGHSIKDLVQALRTAESKVKKYGPVLIHARTIKGLGYALAEKRAEKFHSVSPFVVKNGNSKKIVEEKSFTEIFGDKMLTLAKKNPKIIGITAAMASGTGLYKLANERPEQFFDVGICEQHAVVFAAGLAKKGLRPVVALYSTFLQRAFDQIIHDVCLQNLPVVFAIDRAGLVGNDGPTHHGVFDLSFLRIIPNLTLMTPRDGTELEMMLEFALKQKGPVAIRYPRRETSADDSKRNKRLAIKMGQAELLQKGKTEAIVFSGALEDWARRLAQRKKDCALWNARFVKPLDERMINSFKRAKQVTIIEENVKAGGMGSAIMESMMRKKIQASVKSIGVRDEFVPHGSVEVLSKEFLK